MKKVLLILLVVCCLATICGGVLGYFAYSAADTAVMAEVKGIRTTLNGVCKTQGAITMDDIVYFSENFRETYTVDEADALISEVFEADACPGLLNYGGGSLYEMFSTGQFVAVTTVNDKSTATVPYKSGSKTYQLDLVKTDGVWELDAITAL